MTDPALAAHLDQLETAARCAADLFDGLTPTGPTITTDGAAFADALTNWVALATIGHQPCPHLLSAPAQAVVARMDIRRLDCQACAAIPTNPPPGPPRCAWCHTTGDDQLVTVAVNVGAILALGLCCPRCHTAIDGPGGRGHNSDGGQVDQGGDTDPGASDTGPGAT